MAAKKKRAKKDDKDIGGGVVIEEETIEVVSVRPAKTEDPPDDDSEEEAAEGDRESEDEKIADDEEEEEMDSEEEISDDEEEKEEDDEDEDDRQTVPKAWYILSVVLFIVGGLVFGGVYYNHTRTPKESKEVKEDNLPEVAEPTEEPVEEQVIMSEYSLQVLNGSGVAGEAGKVEDSLTSAGFETIETGNAGNYDYTDTEVSLKEGTPEAVFDSIKETLGEDYTVVKKDNLDETSEYDVVIIIGTSK